MLNGVSTCHALQRFELRQAVCRRRTHIPSVIALVHQLRIHLPDKFVALAPGRHQHVDRNDAQGRPNDEEDVRRPLGGLRQRLDVALKAISLGHRAEPFVKYWGDKGRQEGELIKLKRGIRRRPTTPSEQWQDAKTGAGL